MIGKLLLVYSILEERPIADIIVTGLLPRDSGISHEHKQIQRVNGQLEKWCRSIKMLNLKFLKPDSDWVDSNSFLKEAYYFKDFIYLNKKEIINFQMLLQMPYWKSHKT